MSAANVYISVMDEDRAKVSFAYSPNLVALIKTLPPSRRSWNPDRRVWSVDVDLVPHLRAIFEKAGAAVHIEDALLAVVPDLARAKEELAAVSERVAERKAELASLTRSEEEHLADLHRRTAEARREARQAEELRLRSQDEKWIAELVLTSEARKRGALSKQMLGGLCPPVPTGLALRPYQRVGVQFLYECAGRALLADPPGVGKTPQAIGFLNLFPDLRPVVVIVPSSTKYNFAREIVKWSVGPDILRRIQVVDKRSSPLDPSALWHVVSVDSLRGNGDETGPVERILARAPAAVIIDEAHYLKDPQALRSQAVRRIVTELSPRCVLLLTGTPLLNRVSELWHLAHLARPDLFPSRRAFMRRYCATEPGIYDDRETGVRNAEELEAVLRSTVMIRREKAEVLTELPPKERIVELIELDDAAARKARLSLDRLREAARQYRKERAASGAAQERTRRTFAAYSMLLQEIERERQEAIELKWPAVMARVRDLAEQTGKLVVFAHHVTLQERVAAMFPEPGGIWIGAHLSPAKKMQAVDRVNDDPRVRVAVCSLMGASEGVSLTAADTAVMLECWWNPGKQDQAEDRLWRIGQGRPVTIYYPVARGTIEETIAGIVDRKRELACDSLGDLSDDARQTLADAIVDLILDEGRTDGTAGTG